MPYFVSPPGSAGSSVIFAPPSAARSIGIIRSKLAIILLLVLLVPPARAAMCSFIQTIRSENAFAAAWALLNFIIFDYFAATRADRSRLLGRYDHDSRPHCWRPDHAIDIVPIDPLLGLLLGCEREVLHKLPICAYKSPRSGVIIDRDVFHVLLLL